MTGRAAYPLALAAGAAFAVWLLSWHAVFPADPLHAAFVGDQAVSVIGQRYFLAEPWGWPLLRIPALAGTSVALTDSIPLAMLALKPFRALLQPGASASQAWLALAFALQPAAAVFALRSAGERRLGPAAAVALLSLSMPTFLARYGHTALCSHAAILLGLGLYFRLAAGRRCWPAAVLLMLGCLLIHPYILAVTGAVLAAAPLTLLLRGDRRWLRAAAGFGAGLAVCGGAAWLLGMGGSSPAVGFGFYSMNLLAPLLPGASSLFPELAYDATGGQAWEGYQYLGAGLLLLLAASLALAVRARPAWRRHAGLWLVALGLTGFALSNVGYAGPLRLFHWHPVPDWLAQFRATSRFFWPVAYMVMVLGVATAARTLPPRWAGALLATAVILQLADTGELRAAIRWRSAAGDPWAIDAAGLRPAFAQHRQLTLWPKFGCGAAQTRPVDIQLMLLASETLMRTNTMATARDMAAPECDPAQTLGQPLQPGELRVLLRRSEAFRVPGAGQHCHAAGGLALCSADDAALAPWPLIGAPALPPSRSVGEADAVFHDALAKGWDDTGGAAWSVGGVAVLQVRRPAGPAVLRLDLVGFAPQPGGEQAVSVMVDGRPAAEWRLPDLASAPQSLALPAGGSDPCVVSLAIQQPARPLDRGMNLDTRTLGVLLRSLQLDLDRPG